MISAQKNLIARLRRIPANALCCECHHSQASYADLTVGSFVCPRCSNFLRGIGHSIQGFAMGEFDLESAYFLENNGNERVNMAYMATAPSINVNFDKDSEVKEFLDQKYNQKLWYREISQKPVEKPKKIAPISVAPKAVDFFSVPVEKAPPKVESTPIPQPVNPTPPSFLGAPKVIEAPFDLDSLISDSKSVQNVDPFAEAMSQESTPQINNPFFAAEQTSHGKSDINIDQLFAPTLRRRDLNK